MKSIKSHITVMLISIAALTAGCSKGGEAPVPEKQLPELPPATVTKSGEYTATLKGDTEAKMTTGDGNFKPVFYSLEDGRAIPAEYAATDKWDIAFTSIYNSSIWANNGEAIFENGNKAPGYGSPARGGLYLVVDPSVEAKYYDGEKLQPKQVPIDKSLLDEAYHNVKSVSINDNQLISKGYLTLDHFLGSGAGYAFYDFYGAMFPGDKTRAHIVYNLPRTIIIKTAKGNYAKIIIYSFYKGSPLSPTLESEAPHITFKYTILKDGTKNFTN